MIPLIKLSVSRNKVLSSLEPFPTSVCKVQGIQLYLRIENLPTFLGHTQGQTTVKVTRTCTPPSQPQCQEKNLFYSLCIKSCFNYRTFTRG